nr:hypothetical protein [uncultured Acetatifactor sp.]
MKYSKTILSDENFDDELEKLLNVIGECGKEFDGFVDKLDNSFTNVLVNNCVGFGLSPFYGTQKVIAYDYPMKCEAIIT